MGLLSKGHLKKVSGADLVGEGVGESEQKTSSALKEAIGGVLLIDEAYSLVSKDPGSGSDYEKQVIEMLMRTMTAM